MKLNLIPEIQESSFNVLLFCFVVVTEIKIVYFACEIFKAQHLHAYIQTMLFLVVDWVVYDPGALHLLIYFNSVSWNALSSEAYTCTVHTMIRFTFAGVPC